MAAEQRSLATKILSASEILLVTLFVMMILRPEMLEAQACLLILAACATSALHAVLLLKGNAAAVAAFGLSAALLAGEAAVTLVERLKGGFEREPRWFYSGEDCRVEHLRLNNWGKPNCRTAVTKTLNSSVIYERVPEVFDGAGRRACETAVGAADRHALFFGCSFTFGEGVAADNNLPCSVQNITNHRAFNYGRNGFGPGHMYYILQDDSLFEKSMPVKGAAVYTFMTDHIYRTAGEMERITSGFLHAAYPLFRLDDEGLPRAFSLRERPALNTALRAGTAFRRVSSLGRLIGLRLQFPLSPMPEAVSLTAAVIAQSARAYRRRFDGRFFVVIWPRGEVLLPQLKTSFVAALRDEGIEVIEPPPFPEAGLAQLHSDDPHPSSSEYRWIARYVASDILKEER